MMSWQSYNHKHFGKFFVDKGSLRIDMGSQPHEATHISILKLQSNVTVPNIEHSSKLI